ncbi:vacuolar dha amino acid exporter [Moniliophthora roreri MCA 2997]|uniref:Vacuolar dha amino acid exporter n=2 Tax=Moniliophthora roreri TaxID=221103 RepID=V2XPD0_MONRO|nr:vacuolar dha amino acid exporter [Moniliophthora roreri MCA 2997]
MTDTNNTLRVPSSPIEPSSPRPHDDSTVHGTVLDIEHMPVTDDPRKWSNFRKNFVLLQVAFGSMIAGLSANIQNPSIEQMEADLNASSSQISLTIALFILFQGAMPLLWSAVSEVKGRKAVYVSSLSIFFAGSLVVATSKTIGLVIGFRCLQATGSSAVMAIGAATLADIFDPAERGTKMGIYYMAPLLGPSLGPLLGGALTTAFDWRGPFYFLAIVAGLVSLSFLLLFKDTFRRERSLAYQTALKRHLKEEALHEQKMMQKKMSVPSEDVRKTEKPATPPEVEVNANNDVEKQVEVHKKVQDMKLFLMDINPIKPLWIVLRRPNNFCILASSGLLFAFCFVVPYTMSRTLGTFYGYNAFEIGLVLLSFGIGSMAGSILGGRWSDYQLTKLKAANDGKGYPEMRLRSTVHGSILFPLLVLGFAWVCDRHVHVAGLVVMLFACGFVVIFVYTSTLAYIVDSNVGRSSTAVALNSCFRGVSAFVMTEVVVPMQDGLGDGWTYTIFAGLMIVAGLLSVLVMYKGGKWRTDSETRENAS